MSNIGRLAQDAIAMRFESEGEAWSDTESGDRLARIAVDELEHRGLLRTSQTSSAEGAQKPHYLPEFGPDDCLWLVTVRNQWAVHAHTNEAHAMYDAKTLQDGMSHAAERDDVRVTKITIAGYQALEYRREVVRESLVPMEEQS